MLRQALVILRGDADPPELPGIATVSKDDAGNDGGYALGLAAAGRGALWVDRPYWTGNPSLDARAARYERVIAAGGYVQDGNELNLPEEGWRGDAEAYQRHHDALAARVSDPNRLLFQPPSPSGDWHRWIGVGRAYAVHAYGEFTQMRETVQWYLDHTIGELFVTECNPGAGNRFNLDAWAEDHFRTFLDWCAQQPRVRMVAYFAHSWDQSPRLPSSIDARGTKVIDVLRSWSPPASTAAPAPPAATPGSTSPAPPPTSEEAPMPTPGAIVDRRGTLPVLTGTYAQLAYHDRPLEGIVGATLHYTAGPATQTVEQIAAYQVSLAAAPQTGAGQPFPGIAYAIVVTADGAVNLCHDLDKRTWHSGAVVEGKARNLTHVGICYTGKAAPNAAQVIGIAAAIDWCEKQLGRRLSIEGHGDAMPTPCPGPEWPGWRPRVEGELARLRGPAPAVDPVTDALNGLAHYLDASEAAIRQARAELVELKAAIGR